MYMRIAQKCRSVPLAVAWLTKEDIYRIAVCETVEHFAYAAEDPNPHLRPFISYSYQPIEALIVLQAVVGIEEEGYVESMGLDIDRDGCITTFDALLALQEGVGLIAIAYPAYLQGWVSGIPEAVESPALAFDWELERMPHRLFMYAGDENGDGRVDTVDIFQKYNNLWI